MKKVVSLLLVIVMLACMFTLSACAGSKTQKEEEFYNEVDLTRTLLDLVADDIYEYWYECIYEDKYREDISYAVSCALSDNEATIDLIEDNTIKIKELYKEVKDGKLGDECKAVMQAYNDYYALVVEVSGSFNSYSANKETCKKELSTALKNLSFEFD